MNKLRKKPIKAQIGLQTALEIMADLKKKADESNEYYRKHPENVPEPVVIPEDDFEGYFDPEAEAEDSTFDFLKGFIDVDDYEGFRLALENYDPEFVEPFIIKYGDLLKQKTREDGSTWYDSVLGNTYQHVGDDDSLGVGAYIKPVLGALTAAYNLYNLKKTRDAAKYKMQYPYMPTPVFSTRPIQSLPPEMINNAYFELGKLNAPKTSDSVASIVAEDLVNAKKVEAINKLAERQAQNLLQERLRYDKAKRENELKSYDTLIKRGQVYADIANKQAALDHGIDTQYRKALGETVNKIGSEIMEGLHQRALYNTAAIKENIEKQIATKYNQIQMLQNSLVLLGNSDPDKSSKIIDDIRKLTGEIGTLQDQYPTPTYNEVYSNALIGKTGLKLSRSKRLVKKGCNGGRIKCGGKLKK